MVLLVIFIFIFVTLLKIRHYVSTSKLVIQAILAQVQMLLTHFKCLRMSKFVGGKMEQEPKIYLNREMRRAIGPQVTVSLLLCLQASIHPGTDIAIADWRRRPETKRPKGLIGRHQIQMQFLLVAIQKSQQKKK